MTLEHIKISEEMDGHDFRKEMWKWEQPTFPLYYEFNEERRGQKKREIKDINKKLKGELL